MSKFHLQPVQKRSTLLLGGLTALALSLVAAVLRVTAANEETGSNLMLVAIGLTLGVLVRTSTKRGWGYAMTGLASPAPFIWNTKRRLGVIVRALVVLVIGGLVISGLSGLASGGISLSLLMTFALVVVTACGIVVGLRYGWNEAQASGVPIPQANATP